MSGRPPRRRPVPAAAALAAAVLVVLGACTSSDDGDAAPEPRGPTTSTSAPPDFSTVPLAAVSGATTTTLALRPGRAVIGGIVTGPGGPVAGATVEITRLVGSSEISERHTTLEDGRWEATGILGGRYRIRAWRAPDLAMVEPEIRFLLDNNAERIPLEVSEHHGLAVTAAFAPEAPAVDQRTSLVVQVVDKAVDQDGIVRALPRPAADLELGAAAAWTLESRNPVRSDGAGIGRWILRCERNGVHALAVAVDGGEQIPIQPPRCGTPPTTTTQPPPSTTSSTTTTTSRGGDDD